MATVYKQANVKDGEPIHTRDIYGEGNYKEGNNNEKIKIKICDTEG